MSLIFRICQEITKNLGIDSNIPVWKGVGKLLNTRVVPVNHGLLLSTRLSIRNSMNLYDILIYI